MHLKILSAKWRPCCPGGDELSNKKKISGGTRSAVGEREEAEKKKKKKGKQYIGVTGILSIPLSVHGPSCPVWKDSLQYLAHTITITCDMPCVMTFGVHLVPALLC